jgi:hypothetical protein
MALKLLKKPTLHPSWLEGSFGMKHLTGRSRLLLMHIADMSIDNGEERGKEEGREIMVLVSLDCWS